MDHPNGSPLNPVVGRVSEDEERRTSWGFHQSLESRRHTVQLEQQEIAKLFPASPHASPRRKRGISGRPGSLKEIIMRAAVVRSQNSSPGSRAASSSPKRRTGINRTSTRWEILNNGAQKTQQLQRIKRLSSSSKAEIMPDEVLFRDLRSQKQFPPSPELRKSLYRNRRSVTASNFEIADPRSRPVKGSLSCQGDLNSKGDSRSSDPKLDAHIRKLDIEKKQKAQSSKEAQKTPPAARKSSNSEQRSRAAQLLGRLKRTNAAQVSVAATLSQIALKISGAQRRSASVNKFGERSSGAETENLGTKVFKYDSPMKSRNEQSVLVIGCENTGKASLITNLNTYSTSAAFLSQNAALNFIQLNNKKVIVSHIYNNSHFVKNSFNPLRNGPPRLLFFHAMGQLLRGNKGSVAWSRSYGTTCVFSKEAGLVYCQEKPGSGGPFRVCRVNEKLYYLKNDLWNSLLGSVYIVIFALDDPSTFDNAMKCLVTLKTQTQTSSKPVILVANKSDSERIQKDLIKEARSAAKKNKVWYIEVSANLNQNIDKLWAAICLLLDEESGAKPKRGICRFRNKNQSHSCDDVLLSLNH